MKLNIASGPNCFPSPWLNLDKEDIHISGYLNFLRNAQTTEGMPPEQVRLCEQVKAGLIHFKKKELTLGFAEFPDESVDAIYIGQAIEHVNRETQAEPLIRECYRMLRNGGSLRITTPDLDLLVDAYRKCDMMKFSDEQPPFYRNAHPSAQLSYIMFGASGGACTQQNYEGHFFLYSRASMSDLLRAGGFVNSMVRFEGKSECFSDVTDYGLSHSLACEVTK